MNDTNQNLDRVDQAIRLQEAVEFIWRESDLLDRHGYKPGSRCGRNKGAMSFLSTAVTGTILRRR